MFSVDIEPELVTTATDRLAGSSTHHSTGSSPRAGGVILTDVKPAFGAGSLVRLVRTAATTVDPRTPWTSLVVWFVASFALGSRISIGYTGIDTARPPTATTISTPDGSWAEITIHADNGNHPVTEGSPAARRARPPTVGRP